jgi:nucleoid-associated protein YgaU
MGLFNFTRNLGESIRNAVTGGGDPSPEDLKKALLDKGITLQNLQLSVNDGVVQIGGIADNNAEREKAILIVGNTKGVEKVQESIQVLQPRFIPGATAQQASQPQAQPQAQPRTPEAAETRFYTVQSGDTLSKISKEHYGEAGKYMQIFEANKPMLSDPDKIYPGQVLRVPPEV